MAESAVLDDVAVDRQLVDDPALAQWRRDAHHLRRTFEFADFSQAFAFMVEVALVAERLFHHPDWSNVYNRVEIAITNHDAGGLTELDLEFARSVSALVR